MGRVSLRSVGQDCLRCQKALITLHSGKALTPSGDPGPHVLCAVTIATQHLHCRQAPRGLPLYFW